MTSTPRNQATILFVDDEPNILDSLKRATYELEARCLFAQSGADGLALLEQESIDIVVSDMKMPNMTGVEFLSKVASQYPETIRLVLTGHSDSEMVMDVINEGKIFGYLHKPCNGIELLNTLNQALQTRNLLLERLLLQQSLAKYEQFSKHRFHGFIGDSPEMQVVYHTIEMVGPSSASVFITGASGTGKEVAAEAIHQCSTRADRPFIAINCAALPKDLIESEIFGHVKGSFSGAFQNRDGAATLADKGTLFLDELAEMDIGLQAKLLRFIQTGTFQRIGSNKVEKVDIRFISATNKDPLTAIENKELREDLYYRLNVVSLDLPDLSDRSWDSIALAEHFMQAYAKKENKVFTGFSPDAEKLIMHYPWPGNVRQLQNAINSLVILGAGPMISALEIARVLKISDAELTEYLEKPLPFISAEEPKSDEAQAQIQRQTPDLPSNLATHSNVEPIAQQFVGNNPLKTHAAPAPTLEIKALSAMEREIIELAIEQNDGSVVNAAKQLQVSPSTLYRKMQAWKAH